MKSRGFLGLPSQVQELILNGLDDEVNTAESSIKVIEQTQPLDTDMLSALKGDILRVKRLRTALTSGQA
ncbi:hypothetical protein G7067_02085 [Leucobacter insecticola]|uniref:Uncharacterized protein n=1 Tax=Leucobacter insecticola TaxID=2714934 RepID=A0A6G8FGE5_9MICO|nr:hypothetical protein [Leucobacter insecticola]QIM15471.1 hypothetical protein G7067_02085 [Leucobacter insecticola]